MEKEKEIEIHLAILCLLSHVGHHFREIACFIDFSDMDLARIREILEDTLCLIEGECRILDRI